MKRGFGFRAGTLFLFLSYFYQLLISFLISGEQMAETGANFAV